MQERHPIPKVYVYMLTRTKRTKLLMLLGKGQGVE